MISSHISMAIFLFWGIQVQVQVQVKRDKIYNYWLECIFLWVSHLFLGIGPIQCTNLPLLWGLGEVIP